MDLSLLISVEPVSLAMSFLMAVKFSYEDSPRASDGLVCNLLQLLLVWGVLARRLALLRHDDNQCAGIPSGKALGFLVGIVPFFLGCASPVMRLKKRFYFCLETVFYF